MTQNTHTISVIICAHTDERWQNLVDAVASVQRQTQPPEEIIVVIDHNTPLFARARQHLQHVLVIENTGQRGLSSARNSGIIRSNAEVLAFLDDDALADEDWLERLYTAFNDERVLGSGGAIIPLWSGAAPDWFPPEFYWVVGCTYRGLPETDRAIRNLIGANMVLRRSIFEQAGGFRSSIGRVGSRPVGCEETELCIRAHQHWPQGIFLYRPLARVQHRVPQKRATWRYFVARCYAEGLSKAIVSSYVGASDSLSSERDYTLRTLPQGVIRNLAQALLHRHASGLARAGAILAGLSVTTAGYIVGRISLQGPEKAKKRFGNSVDDQQLIVPVHATYEDIYAYDKEGLPG